ncbi:hypothetical protein LZK82_27975 (plasmid) [Rhizobium leguminosarum]|uniref:hypothetical protein n=1 Tax=Rhizobium leguminosarum TaxID=384 RepID=UPI000482FDF3|nr:hypothetical protein [Rhizobium leguminosarum]UIK01270.1 hypothetical protein LZK82_27975 [Rhizobium leguminosarum]UIK14188.1 hypothetical protein LZK80_33615 [Rhizobium leguminosarum]UIL30317.1 hypothetical protein LZK75_28330 [Rhizobium leguminosarum]WFT90967.1 hypothetical protein QA638_36690 [Rhizobium leguminosarum]
MPHLKMQFSISRRNKISGFFLLFSVLCCSYASEAVAQVPIRQALTLDGNAVGSGLYRHLGINNQWVCELSDSPDIHLTFNADPPLHITVRTPTCEGYSLLDGTWPNELEIAPGESEEVCNVAVKENYLKRLNMQAQKADCEESFIRARIMNRINWKTTQFYIQQCKLNPAPLEDQDQSE